MLKAGWASTGIFFYLAFTMSTPEKITSPSTAPGVVSASLLRVLGEVSSGTGEGWEPGGILHTVPVLQLTSH